MYIGLGVVLLVLGAIFSFDVITVDLNYVDEGALGTILIIGGIVAIVASLVWRDRYTRREVIEEEPIVERRRVV